jgi:hypothetical protein
MISIVRYLFEFEDSKNKEWESHVTNTLQKDAEKRYANSSQPKTINDYMKRQSTINAYSNMRPRA